MIFPLSYSYFFHDQVKKKKKKKLLKEKKKKSSKKSKNLEIQPEEEEEEEEELGEEEEDFNEENVSPQADEANLSGIDNKPLTSKLMSIAGYNEDDQVYRQSPRHER